MQVRIHRTLSEPLRVFAFNRCISRPKAVEYLMRTHPEFSKRMDVAKRKAK